MLTSNDFFKFKLLNGSGTDVTLPFKAV